jgi:hypothetical protein
MFHFPYLGRVVRLSALGLPGWRHFVFQLRLPDFDLIESPVHRIRLFVRA